MCPRAVQTVDKTNEFRQFGESFDQTFSKVCGVEWAELPKGSVNLGFAQDSPPSSRSAEREIPLSAFLFCELFSCAYIAKRKAAKEFVHCYNLYAFGLQPPPSEARCFRGVFCFTGAEKMRQPARFVMQVVCLLDFRKKDLAQK